MKGVAGLPHSRENMQMLSGGVAGRIFVTIAVILMAGGKVAYATWLSAIPSPVYVLFCFSLLTLIFWPLFGCRVGELAWKPILLLNFSTALCFLFFFYALKLIEPAVAGAVQFGIGPVLSVVIAFLMTGVRPDRTKTVVCLGLLAGCSVLTASAVTGAGFATSNVNGWAGLLAILASGTGSVLITLASKNLSQRGWSSGAILAHRCYLILPMAVLLVHVEGGFESAEWSVGLTLSLLVIGLGGTIIPIILLQMGIERSDPHTVLVMMAAMPIFTFLFEGFSSLYVWSALTGAGLVIIAALVLLDVFRAHDPATIAFKV
jgi:drug/metabolite transporter (DMT)-like permease